MMWLPVRRVVLVLIVFSLTSTLVCAHEKGDGEYQSTRLQKPLIFGVAPFMSPVALVKRMSPLRNYLSKTLDRPVIIETTKDAKEYVPRALEGRYDLILGGPTFSLQMANSGLYDLKMIQSLPMVGHLVVLADSPIKTVEDLIGKKIGTPPEAGFLGQLSRTYFDQLGLKGDKAVEMQHFHSHNDAISALRLGETQASLIANFMEQHLNEKGIKIRTIVRTLEYPGLVVLTSSRLDEELVVNITNALLMLGKDDEGKKVLRAISMPSFKIISKRELEKVRPYMSKHVEH